MQNAIFDNDFRPIFIRKIAYPERAGHRHFIGDAYQDDGLKDCQVWKRSWNAWLDSGW